jgi:hypothetical protein
MSSTPAAASSLGTTAACTLRHNSRLHYIGLATRLAGTRVSLLIDNLHIRVIGRDTGELIRELTLDPPATTKPAAYHQDPSNKPRNETDIRRHLSTVSRDITPCARQHPNLRHTV